MNNIEIFNNFYNKEIKKYHNKKYSIESVGITSDEYVFENAVYQYEKYMGEKIFDIPNKIIVLPYSKLACGQGVELLNGFLNEEGEYPVYTYKIHEGYVCFAVKDVMWAFDEKGFVDNEYWDVTNWQLILLGYQEINGSWELIGHDWCFEDGVIRKVSFIPA